VETREDMMRLLELYRRESSGESQDSILPSVPLTKISVSINEIALTTQ
jgi:hypothetical protein